MAHSSAEREPSRYSNAAGGMPVRVRDSLTWIDSLSGLSFILTTRCGNAALELVHGAVELTLIAFVVGEEAVYQIRYLQGFAEGEFAGFAAVLIEDGGLGVLKDGIAGGVSGFEFL